jgi:ribosome-binding protein aMBF1 (putative translation factor)
MKRSKINLKALRRDGSSRPEREEIMFMMPTINMVATGKNIERLRKMAGVSVRDLQDVFGFATPQAIYKWQHGTAMPTIDNLVVLAAFLQVKIDDILVIDTVIQVQIGA